MTAKPYGLTDGERAGDVRRDQVGVWLKRAMIIGIAGWIVCAIIVVPLLIRSGYNQTSFASINDLFDYRHIHPLSFYLVKWFKIAIALLAGWLVLTGFPLLFDSGRFAKRFVPPATPGTIGLLRCLICIILLYYATLREYLPTVAHLPEEMRRPMGVTDWFYYIPGFEAMTDSEPALLVYRWVLASLLVLGAVGLFTRWVLPVAGVMFLAYGGLMRSYTWYNHSGLIPLYLLLLLSFFPGSADGWSLDRIIRIWRGKPVPPSDEATYRYGWMRYVLWIGLAVPYVEAGFSKLRNGGSMWWTASNMRHYLTQDSLKPNSSGNTLTLWLDTAPDWIFSLMGLAAVGGEILMGLVLISWFARMVMPAITAGMHISIYFFQGIRFWDLLALQTIFYDWRKARLAFGQWLNRKMGGAWVVTYDADAESARRAVQIVHGLDLLTRLNFQPGNRFTISQKNVSHGGARAFGVMMRTTPVGWLLFPATLIPALARKGAEALEGRVTAKPQLPPRAEVHPLLVRWTRPAAMTLLCLVLGTAWVIQLEYFPLTAMQMYSKPPAEKTVIYHYKVFSFHEDGSVRKADIGDMMQINRFWHAIGDAWAGPEHYDKAQKFLIACARRHNGAAPGSTLGELISGFRVERWEWHFKQFPDDPNRGAAIDHMIVEVPIETASLSNR